MKKKSSCVYVCEKLGLITTSSEGDLILNSQRISNLQREGSDEKGSSTTVSFARSPHFNSPVTATEDAHTLLHQKIDAVLNQDVKRAELAAFEKPIKECNYTQALRRICNFENVHRVFPLIEALLQFKDKLKFDINEQKGDEQCAAIHYAAKKVAVHGDRSIYDLLVKYGAKEDVVDWHGKTASQYLLSSLAAKHPPSGIRSCK